MQPTTEQIIIIILAVMFLLAAITCLFFVFGGRRGSTIDSGAVREREIEYIRLQTEFTGLNDRFGVVSRQLDERDRELEERSAALAELRNKFGVAEERGRASAEIIAEQQTKLARQKSELEVLRTQNTEFAAHTSMLNDKVEDLKRQSLEAESQFKALFAENKTLGEANASLSANLDAANEKLATLKGEIEQIRVKSQLEFENIANRLLESKSEKFTVSNRESIEQILTPLKKDIGDFKAKVEEVYHAESKERSMLDERVRQLVEKTDQVSAEANNLATALKGQVKTQGNWGEMILERILETNGLVRGREYRVQEPHKNEDGNQQFLDVVVQLPDNRKLIIDSKVTLTAYERYCTAETDDDREKYLREHLAALTSHVEQLSAKKYNSLEDSADFVMLFVPVEPAYLTAIQYDSDLWSRAYAKKIMLISPTNLMAAVKLVADLWSRDMQNKNALEIAKQGEKLYDKFVGFLRNMDDVGQYLAKSQVAYDGALKQLRDGRGNLIGQAEKLRELGVKTAKSLPASMVSFDADDEPLILNLPHGEQ